MPKMIELPEFQNQSLLDFSKPETNYAIEQAVAQSRKRFGSRYPLLISGKPVYTEEEARRENPSNIKETVGYVSMATEEHADEVIRIIQESREAKDWVQASFEERGFYLKKAAQILRWRKSLFIALMMLEVGKTRTEADAEICEAIDFLEYYAAYAPFLATLNQETLLNPQGERNLGIYTPLGIGVSIQPWNFPLAISCGPTVAGLVCGNAMIYKPANHSSIIGHHFAKVLYGAGIPKDVFHFLSGSGRRVGNYLLEHPAVKVIAFTGGGQVANTINRVVFDFNNTIIRTLSPRDRYPKRVATLETGGKGAIIIDSDADFDEAVVGVSDSAFGFQGQKCSAGTRVIIVDGEKHADGTYDRFVGRLADRIASMEMGSPEDAKNIIGPMVGEDAYESVKEYMRVAYQEGLVLARGKLPPELLNQIGSPQGWFLPPMLVGDLARDSRIAQEEVFGPVLAVFRAGSFEEAIDIANDTEYALTGGVYSRNPKHIEQAVREFEVGNLYVNSKITGAVVGRQPFGGHKMSGNSTKAGGWDYLLNFLNRKNIRINTMRRGAVVG